MAQLALITGGAVRIGRAIALHLATRGFSVAIQFRGSKAEAEATVAEIQAMGVPGACFQASLTEHAEVESLLPSVNHAMGRVTCLINNASTFADDRIETLSEESWNRHIAINLKAPLFLAQAFAAQLPAGEAGNIINIVDQRVLRPNPLFFSYTLSKSALWAATKTMAQGLAPRIRVNSIGPGPTLRSSYQSEEDFEHECRSTPLAHGTTPEEIANAVWFILNSPAMTGQMIALDGGQHLIWQTPDIRVT
jgi:NAD(P)-dependent dehydrogenase (short-subunit alcohol dehydrogenase family)